MPISAIDNCSSEHWAEVLSILKEVIISAHFKPNLVSDADEIGVIQKRIIQNLYDNELVVCDVSCKNPNVMFELGMRLAFDKPTIIIKDDQTDYTFDTSVIEHLSYPRDLRFTKIIDFKDKLEKKLVGTHLKYKEDPQYSTFLKNFGQYKIATLDQIEVSPNEYILKALDEIKGDLNRIKIGRVHPVIEQERSHILHLNMDRFAFSKKIQFYDLDKYLDELLKYLSNVEELKRYFLSEQELKDHILESLPPY